MIRLPFLQRYAPPTRRSTGLADLIVFVAVLLLFYGAARVGAGFFVAFRPPVVMPSVDLDPKNLPYYAARSTLRMFIALGLSILFTLSYGYAAAKSKRAERVLVPLLDILQSVPVLGFLSVTVTLFISLFPGSLLGLECASIFAIFTGQAWNMAFSFYNSLVTLPKELDEAATVFRFSKWRRFVSVEIPASMIGLVWNGMMSFGGGWFFLAASEAISVLGKSYTLPGLGSYAAKAVETKNLNSLVWAIVTMILVVVVVDQVFWRPVVAWAEKFRMDRSASANRATSWVLDLLRSARIITHVSRWFRRLRRKIPRRPVRVLPRIRRRTIRITAINADLVTGLLIGACLIVGIYQGGQFIRQEVPSSEFGTTALLGLYTLIRVILLLALSCLVWVPVGVAIGFNPNLARIMQPIVQILASFPANFVFPAATVIFLKFGIHLDFGSILLMALGAQWYILFNAIAGAMAVPNDLREMATCMRLKGWHLWHRLILPAIFPFLITGVITASGGAWNASIVSEVVSWGDTKLTAHGLGSYIAAATDKGDWPRIVLGVGTMCVFVVGVNRLLWRRLYSIAEAKYRL